MRRYFAAALMMAALANCGAGDNPANRESGGNAMDNATLTKFTLTSDDFTDGQPIPAVHSCDGADQSPALRWDEPPAGTKSLALVMDDPDAPSGTFRHWAAYDIPPATRSIERGQSVGTEAVNGSGASGYKGPCPPPGHGVHHYHFKLYALDVDTLGVPADARVEQVEAEARKHQVGLAELTGTFERK